MNKILYLIVFIVLIISCILIISSSARDNLSVCMFGAKKSTTTNNSPLEIWKQDTKEIFENMVNASDRGFEMEYEECIREINQYKNEWINEEDGSKSRKSSDLSREIDEYNQNKCDKLFG